MQPEYLLQQQAAAARYWRTQQATERQFAVESRQQFSATLVAYNADECVWMARLEDGSIVPARAIFPSAARGVGDVVSLYKPGQGIAVVDWV